MKNENDAVETPEEEKVEVLETTEAEEAGESTVEEPAEADTNEADTEKAEEISEVSEEDKSEEDASDEDVSDEEASDVEEAEQDVDQHIENLKKNDAAKLLVKKATIIVNDAESQLEECKLLLESDLKGYESAKQSLKENGLEASEALLSELGYKAEETVTEEESVVFEPKEELAPIAIKDISSGGFTGLILALIAGAITYLAMVYVAAAKAGITFYASHAFEPEALKPVMGWYATLVGMADKPMVGGAIIAVSVLLVMWIVYKIRVSIKASANVRMAKEQLAAAEAYCEQKGSCKKEMDKVDAYINDAIETLNLYKVILGEQRGKLERILHLEKEKIQEADFHPKSQTEINDTLELIAAIKDFMSVPMSEEGKLSGKSSLFLHRAKNRIQKVIDRLY